MYLIILKDYHKIFPTIPIIFSVWFDKQFFKKY